MKYINLEYHPHDSRIRIADDEIMQTLSTRMGTGGGNVPIILLVLDDQGGGIIQWNFKEKTGCLRANTKHHEPVVVIEEIGNEPNSMGCAEQTDIHD